jgi:hypothetical protein
VVPGLNPAARRFDQDGHKTLRHEFCAATAVADMLDVSRRYIDRLSKESETFPEPEVVLASGRIWTREAIEARAEVAQARCWGDRFGTLGAGILYGLTGLCVVAGAL